MKIQLLDLTIRELVAGYCDDGEGGVVGYGGKLDIRPPYQREFVYNDQQRVAVIASITQDFPLNVMYWSVRDDGTYEIIDGQQRTISIAQYVTGVFSFNGLYFHNLPEDKKRQILDYALTVYRCSGEDSERLDWFEIINIAGVKLTQQEMRNAVYAGPLGDGRQALFQPIRLRLPRLSDRQGLSPRLTHSAGISGNGHPLDQRRRDHGLHGATPA